MQTYPHMLMGCVFIEPRKGVSLQPEQIDFSPCHIGVTNSVEKRANYGKGAERKKQGNGLNSQANKVGYRNI